MLRTAAAGLIAGLFVTTAFAAAPVAPPPIEAYGALPQVEQVSLSPNGERVAMIFHKGDQRAYIVRSLVGDKKILQSIGLKDSKARSADWADDDHLFVTISRTENVSSGTYAFETGVTYLINLKTGKATPLQSNDSSTVRGSPLVSFKKDGRSYSLLRGGKGIQRLDLDSLAETQAVQRRKDEAGYVFTPQGEVVARTERLDYGKRWRVLAGPDGDRILAQGETKLGGGEATGLGRTPDTILVQSTDDGDHAATREISLKTGVASAPLVQGAAAGMIHDPKSHLLIGLNVGAPVSEVQFFDDQMEIRWQSVRAAFKGKKVFLESTDDAMEKWVVRVESPSDAGHYYMIDLKAKQAVPFGAAYPDIPDNAVGHYSWFNYKAADGTPLQAVLTLPPGYTRDTARSLPVVVMPHGGPRAHDSLHFDWWSQAIASRGYVVLQPNFRGSDGYGRKFEEAGWGQWGKLMQTDVSDGLAALAAAGTVDPKRACIVGWSYGGYATLAGVTLQKGLYRCAAAGGAVSDLNGMLVYERARSADDSRGEGVRYWKYSMALKDEGDPAGAAVSPLKQAAKLDAPLLLLHGRDDTVVPYVQATQMLAAGQRTGQPVELVTLPGEDHWLSGASTRIAMLKAMIAFLQRYNPA